ncbi:MAG TPA: sigma 54-interacting transcriptional regulator [Chthoniobacterales bacterium]
MLLTCIMVTGGNEAAGGGPRLPRDAKDWGEECAGDCSFSSEPPSNRELENLSRRGCRVVQDLRLLFSVSQQLQTSVDLKEIVRPVLTMLAESLDLYHGTVRILNRATDEIMVDEISGQGAQVHGEAPIVLGERVAGQVAADGTPRVVPDIDSPERVLTVQELHASRAIDFRASGSAFLCVPVQHGAEVMGTLSVHSRSRKKAAIEADLRLLHLTAQLIAQAVKLRQHAREQVDYFKQENERLQEQLRKHFRPDNMIGNSRAMQLVYHSIEQVASSRTTVLIRGESGVGKELVAHAIHMRSERAHKPLVKVNCAALPESIVESELFGHERGAFTGAIAMRKGRFEMAHGGTIFLDEIGELPLQTQAKLLRILQEREFERVGGSQTLRCDVRVIAATNRALEDYMKKDKFRIDLYYRLNVFPIYVPPLRERKTDILQLADFFVEKYSSANRKDVLRISTPAIDMLMSYHWPGNVRELENCMERAVLLASDGVIHGYHLPPTLQTAQATATVSSSTLEAAMDSFEREMIVEALKGACGNMARAARALGLTERIMGLRVKKHEIDPKSFRS